MKQASWVMDLIRKSVTVWSCHYYTPEAPVTWTHTWVWPVRVFGLSSPWRVVERNSCIQKTPLPMLGGPSTLGVGSLVIRFDHLYPPTARNCPVRTVGTLHVVQRVWVGGWNLLKILHFKMLNWKINPTFLRKNVCFIKFDALWSFQDIFADQIYWVWFWLTFWRRGGVWSCRRVLMFVDLSALNQLAVCSKDSAAVVSSKAFPLSFQTAWQRYDGMLNTTPNPHCSALSVFPRQQSPTIWTALVPQFRGKFQHFLSASVPHPFVCDLFESEKLYWSLTGIYGINNIPGKVNHKCKKYHRKHPIFSQCDYSNHGDSTSALLFATETTVVVMLSCTNKWNWTYNWNIRTVLHF